MEWRIIARRTGSLAFPLAGMWVRVVHSAVNAYSLGHNLALTRYLTHKGEEKCGRDSTDVAGRNSSKHSISIHFPSYLCIQRCVLSLSLWFLSLCFVVLCCTLTRTPQSPGVCQQSRALAHIAPGPVITIMEKEISFSFVTTKKIK